MCIDYKKLLKQRSKFWLRVDSFKVGMLAWLVEKFATEPTIRAVLKWDGARKCGKDNHNDDYMGIMYRLTTAAEMPDWNSSHVTHSVWEWANEMVLEIAQQNGELRVTLAQNKVTRAKAELERAENAWHGLTGE